MTAASRWETLCGCGSGGQREADDMPPTTSPATPRGWYTGREVQAEVTYVLDGMGLEPGYVAMAIKVTARWPVYRYDHDDGYVRSKEATRRDG